MNFQLSIFEGEEAIADVSHAPPPVGALIHLTTIPKMSDVPLGKLSKTTTYRVVDVQMEVSVYADMRPGCRYVVLVEKVDRSNVHVWEKQ